MATTSSTFWATGPESSSPAPQGELEPVTPVIVAEEVDRGLRDPGPLDRLDDQPLGAKVKLVFTCWVFLFAFVGAQMAWVLRPFIGSPTMDFAWLRPRESNFFEALLHTLGGLLP